ncbi:MAG: TolC family protein [Hydrotalea sp.]|nr:TolC family protein [Hydrotalea sp.]
MTTAFPRNSFFNNFFKKNPMRLLLVMLLCTTAQSAVAQADIDNGNDDSAVATTQNNDQTPGFANYLARMLTNEPSLKAALYDVYSKGQLYDGTISAMFNPTAVIIGNFGPTYAVTKGATPAFNYDGSFNRDSYTLQISQNLFNGGKDSLAIQQGRAVFHLTEWSYLSTEQNMILQAATAYTNVIKARKAYQIQKWNNNLMSRTLMAARIRYKAGVMTASDLAQSEALKAQNDASLLTAESNLNAATDDFTRIFGIAPGKNLQPIEPAVNDIAEFIKKRAQDSKENWVRDFQTRNPQLQMARLQKIIANIQKDSNLTSVLPKVDLSVSANLTNSTQPNSPSTSKSLAAGITVTQPIWFQGQLLSGSRAVIAAAKVADFQFINTSQKLKQQFNRTYQDYQTNLRSEQSYIQAVKSSRLGVRAANIEYSTGKKTLLDFMQAANTNLLNELNLLNAEQAKTLAMLNLQMMTGDLIAGNFGLRSPYRPLTEQNRNYRGPMDPFAAVSEWIFTSGGDQDVGKDYPRRFREKPKQ